MNLKKTLLDILTYRRPHDSKGEQAFIKKYMDRFEAIEFEGEIAGFRFDNLKESKNKILWSCHIDTVHNPKNDDVIQQIFVDSKNNTVFIDEKNSDCLGADDGAGIALMLSMIENDVHGCYLFHRGEELGRIGSSLIAKNMENYLSTFTHAIAFDRRGTDSVITHQSSNRCCSDLFADQIALLLKGSFKKDSTGSFTDTYSYLSVIPECTNISIGYDLEHTPKESLNLDHVLSLDKTICSINWADLDLVNDRDPSQIDNYYDGEWWNKNHFYLNDPSFYDLESMNINDRYHYLKSLNKTDLVNLIEDLLYFYDGAKHLE